MKRESNPPPSFPRPPPPPPPPKAAFIRHGDRVVIAEVVEKVRVDELVKAIRQALDIEDKATMHAAITRLMDRFEGKK